MARPRHSYRFSDIVRSFAEHLFVTNSPFRLPRVTATNADIPNEPWACLVLAVVW